MEPNDTDGCVPDVDFTIDGATGATGATGTPRTSRTSRTTGAPAATPSVDPGMMFERRDATAEIALLRFSSFEDFYVSSRTSVGRALALTLRDDDLAREAVDEAMARAYQRWQHVSQLDNPGGWVYRVGLNWSRSVVRRWKRPMPIWIAQPDHPTGEAPQSASIDPSVDRALDSLSLDHRAVVVCRLLLGLSELQTADALGIRPGTVKSRLARALDRLQPLLAPLMAPHEENQS